MKIDKEFKKLIPEITKEEFEGLEKSILEEGCRDPLCLWQSSKGEMVGTIIDGHNRFNICRKHNIPIEKKWINLPDRDAVKKWIIENQFSRRNLSPYQRAELALRLEEIVAKQAKERQRQSGGASPGAVVATLPQPLKTRDIIGKQAGVGGRTVDKVKKIQKVASKETKEKLAKGELTINKVFTEIIKREKKEKRQSELKKIKLENIKLPNYVTVEHGDCLELAKKLKDNSISIIVTDPPYPEEFIDCWTKLGKIAARVLKPSGYLIAYSGQMHLLDVMNRLAKEGLNYYWTIALVLQSRTTQIHPRSVFSHWKPLIVFQKSPLKKNKQYFPDLTHGSGRVKELHEWQQSEGELKYIFDNFYDGGTVLEPFSGSGTTLLYCKSNGIKCIGYELDEDAYKTTLMRLKDE